MSRSHSLSILARALLIAALALSSAAAFAQATADWNPEGQDWTAVQAGDAASFAPCPAFACNCNRQSQFNCNGGCIAATIMGCGPGGGLPCNGCK